MLKEVRRSVDFTLGAEDGGLGWVFVHVGILEIVDYLSIQGAICFFLLFFHKL